MKRIGFVGLGIMGAAMSRNLLQAGFELYVYNRTTERAIPLENEGAVVCATPAVVGENTQHTRCRGNTIQGTHAWPCRTSNFHTLAGG